MQSVIEQLEPMLAALVAILESEAQAEAAHYFEAIRADLVQATDEMDLLGLFTFRLANSDEIVHTYGLHGPSVQLLDLILERAMEISAAFTADDDVAH